MKIIKWIFKLIGGTLLLTLLSVAAVYLTLDISTLSPSLERLIKHHTGAEAKLSELSWLSFDTLGLGQVKLTWPLSPEEEEAWEAYRAAKREKKNDENVELPPRPLPALSVCATDLSVTLDLFELIQGEAGVAYIDGLILSCLDRPGSLVEGAARRLQMKVTAKHANGIFKRIPKSGFELKLKGELSEVASQDIKPLIDRLPIKVSGSVNASFNLILPMTRRGALQQRKGDGQISLEVNQLRNEKGMITIFEVPKMNLGEVRARLKLKQGTIHFSEFTIRSPELSGEITGSVGIRSSLSRFALKSHISLKLSPEFVKNTPDIKKLALLQRKFFKQNGEGYDIGLDLRGQAGRPRVTPKEYSPYSKEGRAQQRERRASGRPAARPKAKRAARPKVTSRSVGSGVKSRPARRSSSKRNKARRERRTSRREAKRERPSFAKPEPLGPVKAEGLDEEELELDGGELGDGDPEVEGGSEEERSAGEEDASELAGEEEKVGGLEEAEEGD